MNIRNKSRHEIGNDGNFLLVMAAKFNYWAMCFARKTVEDVLLFSSQELVLNSSLMVVGSFNLITMEIIVLCDRKKNFTKCFQYQQLATKLSLAP